MTKTPKIFKAASRQGCFVYCYTRKDGSPYYVGISKNARRPLAGHCVQVPADIDQVQIVRDGLTRQEACDLEQFLITSYGRKDLGTGILRNRTAGGDNGSLGYRWSKEQRQTRDLTAVTPYAEKLGLDPVFYLELQKTERLMLKYLIKKNGLNPDEAQAALELHRQKRTSLGCLIRQAAKYGLPLSFYASLSDRERRCLRAWLKTNPTRNAADYFLMSKEDHQRHASEAQKAGKSKKAAAKYGVTVQSWNAFTAAQRALLSKRYGKGKRGSDLFVGIPATMAA